MHLILFFAFLPAPAVAEPLRAGCSTDDVQIATVTGADRVRVQLALAGESPTCYKVAVDMQGKTLTGYVLGESLPAVVEFVHVREKESEEAAKQQARIALAPPVRKDPNGTDKDPSKPANPFIDTQFPAFAGPSPNGKTVSLDSLKGRAVVITFWSPRSRTSQNSLMSVMPLYNQLHKSGLDAVGVSMDADPNHITSALDDMTPGFPQVADQHGLAARYHVDPRAGETFVIDASHRVVAAGPMGPQIEKAVQQLLAAPGSPADR